MSDGPFFAGIDGGGTKTLVVIVDERGQERARIRSGTSNAAIIGHENAASVLKQAMIQSAREANASLPLAAAWFGLSGSDRPDDHRQLQPALKALARSIHMTNDAELLLAGLPERVGVALVAGTGSIAFGVNRAGQRARAGGWGHIFSDEGSGYDLARKMLKAFALEADGRGPSTSITSRLTNHFELGDPHQIINHVYATTMTKGDLAALSRIVLEEADAGDEMATGIVSSTASEMAELAHTVASRLHFKSEFNLAVTGGLFIHQAMFRLGVLGTLGRTWTIPTITIVDDPALTAARALATSREGSNAEGH